MIHATAIVDADAQIPEDCEVGPYAVIGSGVEMASGCWIGPHAVINGPTRMGRDNKIYQFASVGEVPQDMKFRGEQSRLEIGDRNTIRECATVHRGTTDGGGVTRMGSDNLLMAYTHVAHDCQIGNYTVFANNASLAGHVSVGDYAILAGFTAVHQFCRIGAHSFCGMGSLIARDVPPYVTVAGAYASAIGINKEGLSRRGFNPQAIRALHKAFKLLLRTGVRGDMKLREVEALAEQFPEVKQLVQFVNKAARGVIRRRTPGSSAASRPEK